MKDLHAAGSEHGSVRDQELEPWTGRESDLLDQQIRRSRKRSTTKVVVTEGRTRSKYNLDHYDW